MKYEVKIQITQNQSTRVSTSSNIAGRAFSKVEYANDTPVRLGKGVLDVSESKAREEGPEDPVSTILDIVVFCKALGIQSCSSIKRQNVNASHLL